MSTYEIFTEAAGCLADKLCELERDILDLTDGNVGGIWKDAARYHRDHANASTAAEIADCLRDYAETHDKYRGDEFALELLRFLYNYDAGKAAKRFRTNK